MNLLRFIALLLCLHFLAETTHAQPIIVTDMLFAGETSTFCPTTPDVNQVNILVTSADTDVDFFLNPPSDCITYTALRPGIDSALIEACSSSVCDTFLLIVTVNASSLLPVLQSDAGEIVSGGRLILPLLENDQPNGAITDFGLLSEGQSLGASLQLDFSLSYFAPLDRCGFTDQLSYFVCTSNGCDTASVTVTVTCPEIIIYNAVSPNGDGLNEVFFIEGISSFPNAELYIFNAQGSEVYRSTGYRNDWSGNTADSRLLPSGTYYYRLRLNSELRPNGEFSGIIELQR